ncbi:unnamed protein product [Bursaphelenchus xylophilus]|uniref:(pine wood nematode) hypothetical protein n=1 Tax=Bursaphelenchus xylophilus TaxID=6326 RepID=A0A1I7S1X9_BURXY|nr:unnamed protein product [Bursaphelenchus xylophilus]CAG9090087.1 unnamed protein product [Bursaphelenchus xylophilus]
MDNIKIFWICGILLVPVVNPTLQYSIISDNYFVEAQNSGDVDLLSTCAGTYCMDHAGCQNCDFPPDCKYGEEVQVNCTANSICLSPVSAKIKAKCRFCWQIEEDEQECEETKHCMSWDTRPVRTTCRAKPTVYCMGRRVFFKNVRCRWSNGYSWSKTLFLSVTLGGFGADRFYLGLWKSAIGKLFSFGGLGVWTLIDIVLIAIGYVGPADGSEYI